MNSFDTLTVKLYNIPQQAIQLTEFYTCNEYKTIYKVRELHLQPGLTEITFDTRQRTLKITISSKFLHADCFRLISRNTLPDLYAKLDGLGLFTIDWEDFCQAEVLRADVTADVPCTAISEAITSLHAYSSALYSVEDPYKDRSGQKTSIVFQKNRKQNKTKVRLSCYNKLEKLRKETDFLECFTTADQRQQVIDQASDILRLETSFTNFQKMRKYFNVCTNTLENLVHSEEKVLHNIMKEITTAAPVRSTVKQANPNELTAKEFHYYNTLQQYGFDLAAIRATLKSIDPKNLSRNIQPLEELHTRLQTHNPAPTADILKYLEYSY